jgi:hypothetical protein
LALQALLENGFTLLGVLVLLVHLLALIAWQLFQQLFNMIGHLGYEVYPAGWTRIPILKWKTPSTHHFTWWGRWMGTEIPRWKERFIEVTAEAPR